MRGISIFNSGLCGAVAWPRPRSGQRRFVASALAVAAMVGSAPAHAAYEVVVSAESAGQLDYGRAYNGGTYADGAPGGPGYTFEGGTCQPGQFASCTATGYGTTDANPNLTAATEATSIDSTSLPSYYYPQGLHVAASAFATANLASGSVGVADSGTYGMSGCCSGQDGGHGGSSAETVDGLHFTIAGPNTTAIIGISFHVHGGMDALPLGDSGGGLTSVFQLGGGFFEGSVYDDSGNGYTPVFGEAGQTGGWLTDSVTINAPGDFTFNATYGLTEPTQTLGINEYLQETCGAGTACDYAHTGTVAFTLPANVTFTSDSGVFLTQPDGAVPEPASWAMMMMAGLGAIGGAMRRRRRPSVARA